MSTVAAGTRLAFRKPPELPHHDHWRPLDAAVARWVIAHGGTRDLATVAAWASLAEGQGDSALLLTGPGAGRHGMEPLTTAAVAALAASPMVDTADAPASAPFVLDGATFYLRRNFLHETSVAAHLRTRRQAAAPVGAHPLRDRPGDDVPINDTDLRTLFNGCWSPHEGPQRAAVRQALGKHLFVLTGGPGTGKTTTVLRILLALTREHARQHHGETPVIRIAAPTGKAAQRLADALREGGARMTRRPDPPPEHWQPLSEAWRSSLDIALSAESSTLHRLLGSRGRHGGFQHHAGNRLPADIVVVDEASMMDLTMVRALLDALREDARLVLVGDADQLTSVGTGSVLMDIVQAMEQQPGDDLVRLSHCFRADTALVPINETVRRGDIAALRQAWADAESAGRARRRTLATRDQLRPLLRGWAGKLEEGLTNAGAFQPIAEDDAAGIARCLRALRQRQLLCALREGEFGAIEANHAIEALLRNSDVRSADATATWYPGRAIIVVRNDPATGLFNGDVGLCLRILRADGTLQLQVHFDAPPGVTGTRASPALRRFDPATLPANESAFALTVHKSQGSEYQHVAVLLPPDPDHPLLSRQMLYTGLSRARVSVECWSTDAAFEAAASRLAARTSGLAARLSSTEGAA